VNDDFSEFEQMLRNGATPTALIARAIQDGKLDFMARIRMIRSLCGLSLAEAKELEHRTNLGENFDQHQKELVQALAIILLEEEEKKY